jgi:hypothetical protein
MLVDNELSNLPWCKHPYHVVLLVGSKFVAAGNCHPVTAFDHLK